MDYKLVEEKDFDLYIDKIINISKLTNSYISILYNYQFSEDLYNDITIIERDGSNKSLKYRFLIDDKLFTFLGKLITKFYENNDITTIDIIDLNVDNKYTFRMISRYNDMFTINDISYERASEFKKLID
jgi:hypothetical protein